MALFTQFVAILFLVLAQIRKTVVYSRGGRRKHWAYFYEMRFVNKLILIDRFTKQFDLQNFSSQV